MAEETRRSLVCLFRLHEFRATRTEVGPRSLESQPQGLRVEGREHLAVDDSVTLSDADLVDGSCNPEAERRGVRCGQLARNGSRLTEGFRPHLEDLHARDASLERFLCRTTGQQTSQKGES